MAAIVLQPAPAFEAQAAVAGEFQKVKLADYQGRYVFLFFYPLDFSAVCPTEIIAYQDRLDEFERRGVQVLGCSIDSHYVHRAWMKTPRDQGGLGNVTYPLVADMTRQISRDY